MELQGADADIYHAHRVLPPGRQFFFFSCNGRALTSQDYPTAHICLGALSPSERHWLGLRPIRPIRARSVVAHT